MVDALLDTSVVVDVLRGFPPSVAWFQTQTRLGVSRAVVLEVIEGVSDTARQRYALQFLKRLILIEQSEADLIWATATLTRFGLSHGVDAFDCMIAATSVRLAVPVYTRNLKHFRPIAGTLAIAPY